MKKLLLLVGILAISGVAFSAEETLKVNAQIISPLSIETNAVDFGVVVAGAQKADPKQNGKIAITGGMNENIQISFPQGLNGSVVTLNNTTGATDTPLSAELMATSDVTGTDHTGVPTGISELSKRELKLGEDGKLEIPVTGSLSVDSNAIPGSYSGTVTVKAEYTFSTNQ